MKSRWECHWVKKCDTAVIIVCDFVVYIEYIDNITLFLEYFTWYLTEDAKGKYGIQGQISGKMLKMQSNVVCITHLRYCVLSFNCFIHNRSHNLYWIKSLGGKNTVSYFPWFCHRHLTLDNSSASPNACINIRKV